MSDIKAPVYNSPPVVGQKYPVLCVLVHLVYSYFPISSMEELSSEDMWVPIYGPPHKDLHVLKVGSPGPTHYHVDTRFLTKAQAAKLDSAKNRNMNICARIIMDRSRDKVLPEMQFEVKELECVATQPVMAARTVNDFTNESAYQTYCRFTSCLENDFAGAKMVNMVCPHQGMSLSGCPVVGGLVQCPLHGLKWNIKTGNLVPYYTK